MRIKKLQSKSESVADIPNLKDEANGWDPSQFGLWSKHRVSWKCSQGHIWEQVIKERVHQKIGCPVCSNLKVLRGFNDLLTVHPEIASEADGWDPSSIVFSSTHKKNGNVNKGTLGLHPLTKDVEKKRDVEFALRKIRVGRGYLN